MYSDILYQINMPPRDLSPKSKMMKTPILGGGGCFPSNFGSCMQPAPTFAETQLEFALRVFHNIVLVDRSRHMMANSRLGETLASLISQQLHDTGMPLTYKQGTHFNISHVKIEWNIASKQAMFHSL